MTVIRTGEHWTEFHRKLVCTRLNHDHINKHQHLLGKTVQKLNREKSTYKTRRFSFYAFCVTC